MATKAYTTSEVLSRSFDLDSDKQEGKIKTLLVDSTGAAINAGNPLPVDTELSISGDVIVQDVDINDISAGTQTNDVKITLDGEDVSITPGPIQGRTKEYEDSSFVTGESPVTHDVNTDLARNSVDGYIACDGDGDIKVEFSDDGSNWGGQHTMKANEVMDLKNLDIDSIRITWVADSSYRILVI